MKNLKKISGLFYFSLVALTLVFTFVSCGDDDDDKVNNTFKLSADKVDVATSKAATVTVSGGTSPYTATSSDEKIATVKVDKSTITITGVKSGSATITVTDKNKNTGKVTVTVKEAVANELDLSKKDATVAVSVNVGKEDVVTIKGGVAPYTASAKDASIATATIKNDKVTIKGVKAGTTTITVADKDKKNSGTVSVTIK
ncbi:MAG: Ig-like domain-containing protein [Dysgonomonas sp.]